MSSQQNLKLEREKELENLHGQISLLGNFLNLTTAIIGANFLRIARAEIKRLIDEINSCTESTREPLFNAELGFDKDGK
jgi:hypothetical protein